MPGTALGAQGAELGRTALMQSTAEAASMEVVAGFNLLPGLCVTGQRSVSRCSSTLALTCINTCTESLGYGKAGTAMRKSIALHKAMASPQLGMHVTQCDHKGAKKWKRLQGKCIGLLQSSCDVQTLMSKTHRQVPGCDVGTCHLSTAMWGYLHRVVVTVSGLA